MATPVKTSLEAILRRRVFSYREDTDFDVLWGSSGPLFQHWDEDLIVVWDGVPQRVGSNPYAINVVDHLTAFDWAVALCCALNGTTAPARLRVFLLDLQPPEHLTAFATRALPQFLPRLPWVRIYRPAARYEGILNAITNPEFVRCHLGPDSLGAEALLTDLGVGGSPGSNGFPLFAKDPETAQLLQQLWQAQLTKSEDRHSIANLIGPAMLLQGMGPTGPGIEGVESLRTLLKKIGLFPKAGGEPLPWIQQKDWSGSVDRFVLIDDMASLGWKTFVRGALQISHDHQLAVYEKPDACGFGDGSQTILNLLADNEGNLRLNKRMSISGAKKEILLLDLRLFASRAPEEEFRFLGQLLELARQAPRDASGLRWPQFSDTELTAIERSITRNTRGNDDYYLALTLLPRLLALVDPTLPIVLFSSTGQRVIMNGLKGYGTIITDFDKPRFYGEASETWLSETKQRFERAVSRAITMSKARKLLHDLTAPAQNTLPTVPRFPASGHRRLLEVYIDESGQGDNMRVGGLALLYPDEESIGWLSQLMYDRGLVWGADRDFPDRPRPRAWQSKQPPWDKVEEGLEIVRALTDEKIHVAAVALEATTPAVEADWLRHFGPDHTYRALLERVLEYILFLWRQARQSDVDIRIFVATRINNRNRTAAETWNKNWGIGFKEILNPPSPDETHISYLFSSDDVRPVIETIIAKTPWPAPLPNVLGARGVTLDYYEKPLNVNLVDLPRQIHYAADWVVRSPDQVPVSWWENGFSDIWDGSLDYQLQAAREADTGDRVAALHAWYRADEFSPTRRGVRAPLGPRVHGKVRTCGERLTDKEFVRLCDLISL